MTAHQWAREQSDFALLCDVGHPHSLGNAERHAVKREVSRRVRHSAAFRVEYSHFRADNRKAA